jgi:hypothetical protein
MAKLSSIQTRGETQPMIHGETDANGVSDERGGEDTGDVETAGETTAADTISGPTDTRPVVPHTTVEPPDARNSAERSED